MRTPVEAGEEHAAKVKHAALSLLDRIGHDGMGRMFPDAITKAEAVALYASATGRKPKVNCGACDAEVIDWLRSFKGLPSIRRAASPSLHRMRLSICRGNNPDGSDACEHLAWPGLNCRLCGCFVDVKARLKKQKCPAGKW